MHYKLAIADVTRRSSGRRQRLCAVHALRPTPHGSGSAWEPDRLSPFISSFFAPAAQSRGRSKKPRGGLPYLSHRAGEPFASPNRLLSYNPVRGEVIPWRVPRTERFQGIRSRLSIWAGHVSCQSKLDNKLDGVYITLESGSASIAAVGRLTGGVPDGTI